MKIGISVTSAHPDLDPRDAVATMVDRAKAANQANLDSLFVGDHHVAPINYMQNTPILGRLLAEWDERPSGALFLLPLWNPVMAAEQIATLANIAGGPFIMQCGLGHGEHTFKAMGLNIRYRPSMFEESLIIMQSLWTGETVSSSGRYQIEGACVRPLPPHPIEIWIGATAPVAIDRTARLGHVWLADPSLTLAEAESAMNIYRDCLDKYQKNAKTIALRKDIYVAASKTDAEKVRERMAGYRGISPDSLIIGDVDSTAEQMQKYGDLGYTDLIIRNLHPDSSEAIKSIERLAHVKSMLENS